MENILIEILKLVASLYGIAKEGRLSVPCAINIIILVYNVYKKIKNSCN